ncbi:hypothetical protein PIROE2DRAFT_8747 [Piromyces sp. E2]|nr:hypothetical protein PIROE2DRAFT_8747 [Piromyces sp. E2]|eukprot:OUM64442.1 hypothetical protein PIROE2DRAFT_8747 [Piromyces sp. E2]
MSKSEFENFSSQLLKQLKEENKKAVTVIDNNSKIVEQCLLGSNSDFLKTFVKDLNTVILEKKTKKFKIFESVLNHKLFVDVLKEFKNSDVLIRACKANNNNAAEWLLSMKLNYEVQDENGATALMEASLRPAMDFVVKDLLKKNVNVNMVDNNGNNALFYATKSAKSLERLLKSKIDINHVNVDNDSVLTNSCKMDRVNNLNVLTKQKSLDVNHINNFGKTAAMYLVENAQHDILKPFIKNNKIDPNFKNKFGETLVSCFVKSFYQFCIENIPEIKLSNRSGYLRNKRYARTLETLIELGCDFNVPVDEQGNTPIMVFLMMKDYVTCQYLMNNIGNRIDLSKKNNDGVNASYLSLLLSNEVFNNLNYKSSQVNSLSYQALKKKFVSNATFDKNYYESGDITISKSIKVQNNYTISPQNSKIVQQWLIEVYFPKAFSELEVPGYTLAPEFAVFY